jgi:hypothetical protein
MASIPASVAATVPLHSPPRVDSPPSSSPSHASVSSQLHVIEQHVSNTSASASSPAPTSSQQRAERIRIASARTSLSSSDLRSLIANDVRSLTDTYATHIMIAETRSSALEAASGAFILELLLLVHYELLKLHRAVDMEEPNSSSSMFAFTERVAAASKKVQVGWARDDDVKQEDGPDRRETIRSIIAIGSAQNVVEQGGTATQHCAQPSRRHE